MTNHVSAWSIKKPVPTLLLFLILGIVGLFSFLQLGINDNPNIDVPAVKITVTQPGAGPSELESQVTQKVEDAVAGLGKVDKVTSTVTEGTSTTTVKFALGTDTNRATNEVRNAIAQIRPNLPQGINEPVVKRLEFSGSAIMTYAVTSQERSVEELSHLVERTISPALLSMPGVAKVNRLGGVDREIRVDLYPSRLQALGITATQVNEQIRDSNINLPGGRLEVGSSEQRVRTLGSAQTLAEFKNYRIVLPNGETVPLSSLGEIRDGSAEPRQAATFNGEPVVAFSVQRSTGSNLVAVVEGVREAVESLRTTLPEDVGLRLIFTRADFIREIYRATLTALVISCLLTVVTVGLFLRDGRATLITAVALPLSIIPTFGVMNVLGYTLNNMTLLALTLSVGNLVDDAICMIENIDQHLQKGKTPYQAAIDGAREIGLAVVATTATIVAVFIPVAFMGGRPGQFFQPFGITVAVATMFSTLVACMITPLLSAYLLRQKGRYNGNSNREVPTFSWRRHRQPLHRLRHGSGKSSDELLLTQRRHPYRELLAWALRHRITTLLIAVALFIGSLQLIPYISKGLFGSGDSGLSTVSIELPPGSQLSDTEEVMQQTTGLLQDNPAVKSILVTASEVDAATAYVNLVPDDKREISQQQFEEQMREEFRQIPGARVSFRSQGVGGSSKDLSIVLTSKNPEALQQTSEALLRQMRELPGLVKVTSSASLVSPEIIIEPYPSRAADLGVSVRAIARTASLALISDKEANLAKFNLPERQIPIRVQIDPQQRDEMATLRNLRVQTRNGDLVPIAAVADIRMGSGAAQIDRFNRNRQVSLEANLQGISLGDALEKVRDLPAMNPLPPGVSEQPAGDAEIMQDVFARFLSALGLAVLSIYAILVLLYNNFLYPFAILVALPLSIGGALLALLITQKELGLFALLGIVLLMGLVTKNAILLVDLTRSHLRQGQPQFRAVVEAGVSRLRPILMTSVSTIAGMKPIALGWGAGGEVRSPMAIAVIGGFSTSTLLTLVVVPVLFTFLDNSNRRIRNLFNGGNQHPQQGAIVKKTSKVKKAKLFRSRSTKVTSNRERN